VAADLGSGGSANPGGPAGSHVVAYQAAAPNAYEWTEVAYEYLLDGKLTASIRTVGLDKRHHVSGYRLRNADRR